MNPIFSQTRPLMWLGFSGLVLAAVCSAVALLHGPIIAPEGDLTKAITFDAAIGIFILTLALLVPLAGFTSKGMQRWMIIVLLLTTYGYSVETIQVLRGIDPRFTHVGGAVDQIAGAVFGFTALGIMTSFIVLAVKLWRRPLSGPDRLVLLAVRYGVIITMMGFFTGFWMGALQGRHFGQEGNILPVHALSFHALQAIPIVALLFTRSKLPDSVTKPWIHVTGLTWFGICIAVAWQTAAGLPVTRLSAATAAAAALAAAWAISVVRGVRAADINGSADPLSGPRGSA